MSSFYDISVQERFNFQDNLRCHDSRNCSDTEFCPPTGLVLTAQSSHSLYKNSFRLSFLRQRGEAGYDVCLGARASFIVSPIQSTSIERQDDIVIARESTSFVGILGDTITETETRALACLLLRSFY